MEKKTKKLIELAILPELEESGVQKISLVESPAIEADFLYFKKEEFVEPNAGERQEDFIPRCIAYNINEGKDADQAAAICYSVWDEKMAAVFPQTGEHRDDFLRRCTAITVVDGMNPTEALETCIFLWNERFDTAKISYDYDDTLNTSTGQIHALTNLRAGYEVYVISARATKEEMLPLTDSLGIPESNVFATGSDEAKVAKIQELGISTHHDNNQDVVDLLGEVGQKFAIDTAGLPSYVDEVPKSRKDQVETPQPTWKWRFEEEFILALERLGSQLGIRAEDVEEINPGNFADSTAIKESDYTPARTHTKADGEEFVWKYSGGGPGPHRAFCRTMKSLNRYYSREEITLLNNLNQEFSPGGSGSYSIFMYKGGSNCNHYWSKYSVKREDGRLKVLPISINNTPEERMAATAPRTQTGRGYLKSPQNSLPGLSGHSEFSSVLRFEDEEKGILVGPAMIPNMPIPRIDDQGKMYDVTFSEETIEEIAKKYMKEARTNDVNQDHKDKDAGTYVFETWVIEDPKTDKANTVYGFNLPKGTWMVKMQIEDPEVRRRVKAGELRGFSVEGVFSDLEEIEAMKRYMKIKKILSK